MSIEQIFRENLTTLLTEANLSATEAAREIGVGNATISKALAGTTSLPHLKTRKKIADYFGVPIFLMTQKNLGRQTDSEGVNETPSVAEIVDLWGQLTGSEKHTVMALGRQLIQERTD